MKEQKPTLYMAIGVSGSGKSTYLNQLYLDLVDSDDTNRPVHYLSTDGVITTIANEYGLTYQRCFDSLIGFANIVLDEDIKRALHAGGDVIWDQMNLTAKSRAKKLGRFAGYRRVGLFFETPSKEELARRMKTRSSHLVPLSQIERMILSLEEPSLEEGFDEIIHIKND